MKNIIRLCAAVAVIAFLLLAGCKVEIAVPVGGKVITESVSNSVETSMAKRPTITRVHRSRCLLMAVEWLSVLPTMEVTAIAPAT